MAPFSSVRRASYYLREARLISTRQPLARESKTAMIEIL